ncbi:hypothetical protein [Mucilaginibacter sp.]|uniref:hypothetical protein n=1 Tax=Mucilaginibacter sp. TaxID=1882438 RepID=UPI0026037B14|nr:hypothetical protein [Mucilaginibacter sp.]MDB4919767.1 hypothetical protein [Mucilaginibacter sp.]
MKRSYFTAFCLLLLCSVSVLKAQDVYQPGYVILNDGIRLSGTIILYANSPWLNQQHIFLKDSAAVAANPNGDVKPKKYKTGDIKYYQVGDRKFDKVHYVESSDLHFRILGSNDHMLERLTAGRIASYRYYSYPPDMDTFTGSYEDYEKRKTHELLAGYKILARKDNDGKYHDILNDGIKDYLKDAPDIMKKYDDGTYGNEPSASGKGLMAKMIARAKKTTFKQQEADAIVAAFNEFNQEYPAKK